MKDCPNCGHSEDDHIGHWAGGELIPGKLCFYDENRGYQEDLCPCPGFDVTGQPDRLQSLMGKAGLL